MTSRNTGPSPAKMRPARMSVARAVTKGSAPTGSAPLAKSPHKGAVAAAIAAAAKAGPGVAPRTRARGSATALRADQKRLAELKVQLSDPEYMNGAILRIATVLSARLTLR